MEFIHLEKIDSTNNQARRLLSQGKCLDGISVVYADEQYSGRGQKGNSWESQPGKNITFSIICHPLTVAAPEQFILSQAIALSLLDVLRTIQEKEFNTKDKEFSVKWPNDIYYENKKISGTLIECDLKGKMVSNCIIGSGVNINQERFLSDAPNPVSLYQIYGHTFNPIDIMEDVCTHFEKYFMQIEAGKKEIIREEYLLSLYRKDGIFPYSDHNGLFEAEFAGIEPTGHLLLRTQDKELRRYEFKEVKYIMGSSKN